MSNKAGFSVGVDWGAGAHQVCLLNAAGEVVINKKFRNDQAGMASLVQCLLDQTGGAPNSVGVAIERPHGALVELLIQHEFVVHSINPKQLDRFRDRHCVAGAKDDRRDAFVLAQSLMTDSWAFLKVQLGEADITQLREMLRIDEDLRSEENGLQNRLREQLLRYFPDILKLIANRADPFLWALLELAATPAEAAQLEPEQITELLKRFRVRRLDIDSVLAVLAVPSLQVSEGTIAAASAHVRYLLPRLQLVHQQRTEVSKKIDKTLESLLVKETELMKKRNTQHTDAAVLQSLPGVGRVVLGTMLGEAGTLIARRDLKGMRSLGGIAPITRRSGKQDQRLMRRACNARLRYAYYHWGRTAIQHDALSKQHYSRLRAKGHSHGRALRGVVDRLLSVAIAMLKNNTFYNHELRQGRLA